MLSTTPARLCSHFPRISASTKAVFACQRHGNRFSCRRSWPSICHRIIPPCAANQCLRAAGFGRIRRALRGNLWLALGVHGALVHPPLRSRGSNIVSPEAAGHPGPGTTAWPRYAISAAIRPVEGIPAAFPRHVFSTRVLSRRWRLAGTAPGLACPLPCCCPLGPHRLSARRSCQFRARGIRMTCGLPPAGGRVPGLACRLRCRVGGPCAQAQAWPRRMHHLATTPMPGGRGP